MNRLRLITFYFPVWLLFSASVSAELTVICNFAFFSGLFDAQFWAGSAQPKSPELTANY